MSSTIVVPDRQIVGANLQHAVDIMSDEFAHAKTDIEALQSGGSVGAAPVHLVRGASTANVASLAAFTVANDGITLVAGERVLLKDQTTASENGIYVVGTVGGGTAPLTRATDMDASAELQTGLLVSVSEGTAALDTLWMLTSNAPLTVGVSDLAFAQAIGALLSSAAPQDVGTGAASAGVGTKAAKDDHVHHIPAATTVAPGAMPFADKAFLDAIRADFGTAIADADATIQIAQGQVRDCPTLTGNHICTLGVTGCTGGEYLIIRRSDATANTLTIKDDAATTLAVFAASKLGGGIFRYSAASGHFELLIAGQLG